MILPINSRGFTGSPFHLLGIFQIHMKLPANFRQLTSNPLTYSLNVCRSYLFLEAIDSYTQRNFAFKFSQSLFHVFCTHRKYLNRNR